MLWCGMAIGYPDWDAKVNTLASEREPVENFATFKSKAEEVNSTASKM